MNRIAFSLLLVLILVITFSQEKPASFLKEYEAADNLYRQAEHLSTLDNYPEERIDTLNAKARNSFLAILPAIEKNKKDSLAFHVCFKIGVLHHYFDSTVAAAYYYTKAISYRTHIKSLQDSLFFKAYVFLGGIQYRNNQFDSALFNYKEAEKIASGYNTILEGTNRLYNTLGAMNFETGNYRQARNYFEKAIALLKPDDGTDEALLINYKINLAATLTRLEEYDAANSIYQELLQQDINKNDILHNVGKINLVLGAGKKALTYFRQVTYSNNTIIRLFNDIGQAYESINEPDSARYYYLKAVTENQRWNKERKNVQAGLSMLHLGELDMLESKLYEAITHYQKAIIQFTGNYNETDIYNNPMEFGSVFSYINLFHTFTAKAKAFEKLYDATKKEKELATALETYRSAFDLAAFVERTYDSDEARLFLNTIKYSAHSKPIDLCIRLYSLTGKKQYLEEAFRFDQQNKASILALSISENEQTTLNGENTNLLKQVAAIKSKTTRLSIQSASITDSNRLKEIYGEIRDNEIELGKLYERIKSDPQWQQSHPAEQVPSVKSLQKKLDNTTAILSYHLSENDLTCFLISRNQFTYFKKPVTDSFFLAVDSLKYALHQFQNGQRYGGLYASRQLYEALIRPLVTNLGKKDRLVIIPDDELHYLPFETLTDNKDTYLIEKYSVQYLYSTALFKQNKNINTGNGTLSFAPFAIKGFGDTTGKLALSKLPESADEISNLSGPRLIDTSATKKGFLETANHFPVIHLATHAIVNNKEPGLSFIAFSPVNSDYKLYAKEIYNLRLDSSELVILSACETGTGQLVRGEGLMSLSRAFTYAGCPNIITSLWKAEDKTTAYITKQLHYYLGKGYTKDKALQFAKLDLLKSDEISPAMKSPNYWAHLIFIGEYEPVQHGSNWIWIALVIVVSALLFQLLKLKKPRRSDGA